MELDLDHLRGWIGQEAEAEDIVTPRLVAEFRSIFEPHFLATPDGEAPPGFHWLLSPAIVPMTAVGADGHPERGGFLPPVPLPRRMWAGGAVETRGPLRVGDTVRRRSRIADVSAKQGRSGALCFVAVRHDYETDRGTVISERHDIVYRDSDAAGPATATAPVTPAPATPAPATPVPASPAPRAADESWIVETSPLLLFRYSAVTFNGHRIHYDLPYVTGQEGYPGLVVHGPIQATLLLNLAAVARGRTPGRFSYRGLSPLIAGEPFRVAGSRDPNGTFRCWTEAAGGRTGMEGDAGPS